METKAILKELNPIQQEAVMYDCNKPLMILAGAGSGKTRVLTYRTAYLISEMGVMADEILLLTFTNKAAGEMVGRVKRLVGDGFVGYGGTFHSFCARILRRYAREAGLNQNYVIFDVGDQLDVIKKAESDLGIDPKAVKPGGVLGAISEAKNNLIGPSEYSGFARGNWSQTVARVYFAYQQLLRRYKALDFDDLLTETVRLVKSQPEILNILNNRYRYILVDEYQDTNKAQYEITKELSRKHKHLTVVGDAAQAIYSWRGADYRNLLLLKQDFPDLVTISLEQNYRSTAIILKASNKVIGKNKNHPILKLWTDREEGEKISIYEAESELEEAGFIVAQIQNNMVTEKQNYSDFAVLYRTNAQSRVLEESMLHADIPYVLVGGVRFYERKEIKDVLAYLRLLLNPEDEVSQKRAERNGKTRLARIQSTLAGVSFLEKETLNILDEILKVSLYLDQYDPQNEEDAGRLENIKELRSVAAQYPKLTDFLEQVALTEKEAQKHTNTETQTGMVTLMTLHSAKGLEFKTVFMVGMEEGLFPHSRTLMNPDELEEERRLCYVGMTRTMDKLYLTHARRRLYFGTRSSNMVSRFLGDIPEELIDPGTKKINKPLINEAPSTLRSGYLLPALRRERNPSEAKLSSLSSTGLRPRFFAKGDKKVDEDFGFDSSGVWHWKPEE